MLDPYGSILFGGIAKRSLIAQSALDFNRSIFDIFTRKFYSSYWRIDWRAILNKPWGFETKRNNFLSYRMGWNIWKQYTYFFNNKLLIRNSTRNVRFETVAALLQLPTLRRSIAAKQRTLLPKVKRSWRSMKLQDLPIHHNHWSQRRSLHYYLRLFQF